MSCTTLRPPKRKTEDQDEPIKAKRWKACAFTKDGRMIWELEEHDTEEETMIGIRQLEDRVALDLALNGFHIFIGLGNENFFSFEYSHAIPLPWKC